MAEWKTADPGPAVDAVGGMSLAVAACDGAAAAAAVEKDEKSHPFLADGEGSSSAEDEAGMAFSAAAFEGGVATRSLAAVGVHQSPDGEAMTDDVAAAVDDGEADTDLTEVAEI